MYILYIYNIYYISYLYINLLLIILNKRKKYSDINILYKIKFEL